MVPLDVTRLGRYQILMHLATGGMADVLLARADGPFGADHVVIKRIRRDQAADPHFVKMFIDEATLAAALVHPNIVKVHEIGNDHGEHFFAMEYVHGEDLRCVLMEVNRRRDKLPIALVTGIVAAAAAGLDHAHRQLGPNREPLNIVHRDVSPANILVGYDGRVKVADFGIAKAALRTVETRSGTLKGKVSYMSPEQVTGQPVDRRSDVFALGIVLYEVATARRLFKGENDFLTMSGIVNGNFPLPSIHRPDLPRILEDIIMKALSPDPRDRYQSAEDLRAELEKFTHAIGMRMSNESVADYMRKLFGTRAEPWLVAEFEPTQTTTIDFDGSAPDLVEPPAASAPRKQKTATLAGVQADPSSPIMMSRDAVSSQPSTLQVPTISAAEWLAKSPTATGSGSGQVIGSRQPPASRRRLGIVIGMTAVAAIAGLVLVLRPGKSNDHETQAVAPATEPQPDPQPTAAPVAAPVAEPEPVAALENAAPADPAVARAEAARLAKEAAAAKAEIAANAVLEAKAAKIEAARIAKEAETARAELATKTANEARAAKLETARIAKEEQAAQAAQRAQAAKVARAEKAKADAEKAKATAEKAELVRAEKAKATAEKAETAVATKTAVKPDKPTATKPRPKPVKSETKWNPNELFPE